MEKMIERASCPPERQYNKLVRKRQSVLCSCNAPRCPQVWFQSMIYYCFKLDNVLCNEAKLNMTTDIATTLLMLLPTSHFTLATIPLPLISLTICLSGASRSRATTLKPEEEIARQYACAHIACERLKQRLNLPRIEPRPPCGPRIYKKLYKFLESALAPEVAPVSAKKPPTSRRVASAKSTPTSHAKKQGVKQTLQTPDTMLDPSPETRLMEKFGFRPDGMIMARNQEKQKNVMVVPETAAPGVNTDVAMGESQHSAPKLMPMQSGESIQEDLAIDEEHNGTEMKAGLATMFQDRVDWLGVERRAESRRWRARTLKQIKFIRNANAMLAG